MEQYFLCSVGDCDAAQIDGTTWAAVDVLRRQYHVAALDLSQFLDQGSRRIPQPDRSCRQPIDDVVILSGHVFDQADQ
jgi:hypothetical protein